MAREARHFVDEAFFVIFGKYLAEFSKSCCRTRVLPEADYAVGVYPCVLLLEKVA